MIGASYVVVQAESIRVVDAAGIVRAAWHSPKEAISSARIAPVVVTGGVIDFLVGNDLLELDPRTGVTRLLASNPGEDVGVLLADGDDLVWSVGRRRGGCIPTFEPTGVQRFLREAGLIVRESNEPCESLGTDGARIYCTNSNHFLRWRPGQRPEADPVQEDVGRLLIGDGLIARGTALYRSEDPGTPFLALEAPPFALTEGSAYYGLRDPQERFALYRATLE